MEDISYVMIALWVALFVLTIGKEIWNKMRHHAISKEYTIIGISKSKKIDIVIWIILVIIWIFIAETIELKLFWISFGLLCIYQDTKKDIIFDKGIGEKSVLGITEGKIKWEEVQSYKRTYQDELVIEYIRKNPVIPSKKNKKYKIYMSEEKINLFYRELQKYIKEKEVK